MHGLELIRVVNAGDLDLGTFDDSRDIRGKRIAQLAEFALDGDILAADGNFHPGGDCNGFHADT